MCDINQYIKILLVCPCVRDGCGRGRYEFAVRVQKCLTCQSLHSIFMFTACTCGMFEGNLVAHFDRAVGFKPVIH